MSEHVITWPIHEDSTTGYKTRRASCACGWLGQPGESGYAGGTSLGQRQEAEDHVRVNAAHNVTEVEHSGKYVRVACECGHKGEWRPAVAPSLQRRLHSDINAHFWALKRMEAQR